MARKVLIVGGVAGGASAAARLRRLDEAGLSPAVGNGLPILPHAATMLSPSAPPCIHPPAVNLSAITLCALAMARFTWSTDMLSCSASDQ